MYVLFPEPSLLILVIYILTVSSYPVPVFADWAIYIGDVVILSVPTNEFADILAWVTSVTASPYFSTRGFLSLIVFKPYLNVLVA